MKNRDNTLKKKSVFARFFGDNRFCWLALGCTVALMMLVYYVYDLFPFGGTTILRMDLYHQYGPLFAEFYDRVTNLKSFIYSWETGLGSPFLGNFFNYLSSPSAIIILLIGHENMPESIAGMILIKAAFAAASFTYYLKKSQNRHDYSTAAFGILYALCGYFVAYYWNVMWIDAMVYFPLVIFGIERIINKRKPSVYIIFLALTLLSNYYMGYMTCIFSVIYFLVYFFSNYDFGSLADNALYSFDDEGKKVHSFRQKLTGNIFLRSGFTFALSSAAAGCLVAFSLIPTFLILKSCSATSGTWPEGYKVYFDAFDFLANHLASVEPTIRSSGEDVLPNVYCGMATLILVPLYIFSNGISLKEKIANIFTLALLFFSFNINYANYVWHGFHFPNDLPYRFSFMYSFLLLVMAYKAFTKLKEFTGKQILGTGVAILFAIVLIQKIGSKNVDDMSLLLSAIFTVTYCLVFYILKDIERQKSAMAVLLLCCTIGEIACADTDNFVMTQPKISYTEDYPDFRSIKGQLDEKEGDNFYRMELTFNRARMDPAWYGYNGVSTFSSMAYEKMSNVQSDLGLYSNYINSYTYYLQTPVYNLMHGIKYVVDNDEAVDIADDYFTELMTEGKFTAYRNDYAMSLGTTVSKELKEWYTGYSNPFIVQNDWFENATGIADVMQMMDIDDIRYFNVEEITSGLSTGDLYFNKEGAGEGELTVFVTVPEARHCYLYVNSSVFDEIEISKNGNIHTQSTDEAFIYDLGIITPDDEVSVFMKINENDSYGYIDFYPYYVDDDAFIEGYNTIKNNQFKIKSFSETKIVGSIEADEDCLFYSSIPYDKGWTVKVDGKEIAQDDYVPIADAYLGFNLTSGKHVIELRFKQRGLIEGAAISVFSLVALLIFAFIIKKSKPGRDKKREEKYRKAEQDYLDRKEQAEAEAARLLEEESAAENEATEVEMTDFDGGEILEVTDFSAIPSSSRLIMNDYQDPEHTGITSGPEQEESAEAIYEEPYPSEQTEPVSEAEAELSPEDEKAIEFFTENP